MNEEKNDGYESLVLNQNVFCGRDKSIRVSAQTRMMFEQAENLYAGNGLAKRIIDLPAMEMLRAGYQLNGVQDQDLLMASLEKLDHKSALTDALRYMFLFGGALIIMIIDDGQELIDPLKFDAIKSIDQLRVYDCWQVSEYAKYRTAKSKKYGETEIYNIHPSDGYVYQVHESRCLIFRGDAVSNRKRAQYNGWGASRLEYCKEEIQRYCTAQYWAEQLLQRAQQAVHKIPQLTNVLSDGREDLVRKKIHLVDLSRSINNMIVIDALEDYQLEATSFAGVPDIIDRFGLALSSVAGIPESLLFGRHPGGMNSTGQADIENWYARIKQDQEKYLLHQLDKLISAQMQAIGIYVENYTIKFCPLSVPSEKEKSETDYRNAQTMQIYNSIGALDASEVRQSLKDNGYYIDDVDLSGQEEDEEFEDEKNS